MHSRTNCTSGNEKCLPQKYLWLFFYCDLRYGLRAHRVEERLRPRLPFWESVPNLYREEEYLGMTCPLCFVVGERHNSESVCQVRFGT